ncbi:hypothetical protein FQR65_LT15121 [Abscondita terminalis]|nr:hypothetical protein FQR65_LT15121 [Abscondita terminalis]
MLLGSNLITWYRQLCVLILITATAAQTQMSCTYKGRGSLTSICVNAIPSYFRTTAYRFDNLDETLRCVNCSLEVIGSYTFDISGNQIKSLDLTDSQITMLKPKSFIGLVFLQNLNLQNNKIVAVPPETFLGITKVEDLNMESNNISALVANGFKELTNLKRLNLKKNSIKTISSGSFNGLGAVEILDLSFNSIETISDAFGGLSNVRLINLEQNKIGQIDPLDMKELTVLFTLSLAKNNLKVIPNNTFLELPRLEQLNLSSNPIEILENSAFRGLDSLEELDLSSCLIDVIQKGLLSALHRLRLLDLSYNRLTVFRTGGFSGLPELRKLNLSHNKIDEYEKTGLFPLHSLHNLDLSFNNLTDLDYKLLVEHLPSLSHIGLEGNPWPCYLKKEMEELFKNDNLIFNLGPEADNPNIKCVTMKPVVVDEDTEVATVVVTVKTPVYVSTSNGHEYVLYVFMVLSIIFMAFLFYTQYRNRQELGSIIGRSNISETRLINSDLEERDVY